MAEEKAKKDAQAATAQAKAETEAMKADAAKQKAALEKYNELCMTEIFLTCCCPG